MIISQIKPNKRVLLNHVEVKTRTLIRFDVGSNHPVTTYLFDVKSGCRYGGFTHRKVHRQVLEIPRGKWLLAVHNEGEYEAEFCYEFAETGSVY